MSNELPQMKIRLPIELKEKIQEIAKNNDRTMNSEIVSAIKERVEREEFFASIPELKKIKQGEMLPEQLNMDDVYVLKGSEIASIVNAEIEKLKSSLIESLMKKK